MSLIAHDAWPRVRAATALLNAAGMAAGDRLLTVLPNTPDAFAIGLACMLRGVVQVPTPPDLALAELAAILEDCRPREVWAGVTGGAMTDLPARWVDAGVLDAAGQAEPSSDAPRTRPMAYTSGTTGRRKGVSVGVHDAAWGHAVIDDEHAAFDRRHGDRHLVVSPLYHSGPFRFAAVTALTAPDARIAVLPSFDADALLQALRAVRPTSLFVVPTHLHRLLSHPDLRADDLASVQLLAHAGAPCPAETKERITQLAPDGAVWEFYGATEGQFTVCPTDVWAAAPGTVGHARPGRRIEVRDDVGTTITDGSIGTVWCHTPEHARFAYFDDPERTAAAWDGDAFTVGDLGRLDDAGRLHLEGRPGDLVITGGVNVYPAEVERVLLAHPAVGEAVVYGVDDADWGQRVTAAVVAHPGSDVDPEALRTWCRDRLGTAKIPKQVRVVDDLPRTPTGKIRRVGLADAMES